MKYHLDRRVVLATESPHPSLYSWCLREIAETGDPVGRDLVPWNWGQYFEAADISLIISSGVEPDYSSEDSDAISSKNSRIIRARLTPERDRDGRLLNRQTTYSMMGTDRKDVRFDLVVRPTNDDADIGCRVWGSPSYTYEPDFRNLTTDDDVVFDLTVSTETFDFYADLISASAVKAGRLRLSGVAGFYSDWSPSISTDLVKILTADQRDHLVELPEGAEIVPPRLGRVLEAHLDLWQKLILTSEQPEVDQTQELRSEQTDRILTTSQSAVSGRDRAGKSTPSVQVALWVIAALLLILVFK